MLIYAQFDIDSTLVASLDLIKLALAEQGYMLDPTKNSQFKFEFIEGYEPPVDFQWDIFFYRLFTERFDEIEPIDDHVYKFLWGLYDGQDPIRCITARPQGALMHHSCMRLLDKCFPDIEFTVTIVDSGADKVKHMGWCDIFFDDRRKTVVQMAKEGMIVLMRRAEYNFLEGPNVANIRDGIHPEPGMIILYDNFGEIIDSGLDQYIKPFTKQS